jgi:hypothetical protein
MVPLVVDPLLVFIYPTRISLFGPKPWPIKTKPVLLG